MGKRLGYNYCYQPEHHRASQDGTVYEHIIVAEKMLNRELYPNEVVHHKDGNRSNNSFSNLMVFATDSDHSRFHVTGVCILENDYYIAPPITDICKCCGKEYFKKNRKQKYCSHECAQKAQQRVKRPSKEELQELIMTKSFLSIGKMFNVSDTAIRKWCKNYNLPYKKVDIEKLKTIK